MPVAELLESWLTGLTVGLTAGARRTVVVEAAELLPALRESGLVDDRTLVLRAAGGRTAGQHTDPENTFEGSFTAEDDVVFDDGYRLQIRQYGLAPFVCLDAPTVLQLRDGDDVSSYLRDADAARHSGAFAEHMTHPNGVVCNLSGLGGSPRHAGPTHRLFVTADALVRTSPTGRDLGRADEPLATLHQRWRQANLASGWPDASGLDRVIADQDRVEALRERPWIPRYVLAVIAFRRIRAQNRLPSRVSGFPGRITPGLPEPTTPDPLGAPLLLQVGREFVACDPEGTGAMPLTSDEMAVVEAILAGAVPLAGESTARASASFSGDSFFAESELLARLSAARVATGWCAAIGGPPAAADGRAAASAASTREHRTPSGTRG